MSDAMVGVKGESGLTPVLLRLLEGRVGSTAVMQLLATSPEIALDRVYPYENSYLTYFTRMTRQLARPAGPEATDSLFERWATLETTYWEEGSLRELPFAPEIVEAEPLARRLLRAVWKEFSLSVSERSSTDLRYYAEKHWGGVEGVLEAGLEPVIIDLVRDPRDIVASIRSFNERNSQKLFGRPLFDDDAHYLRYLVTGMAVRFSEMQKPVPVPKLELRYEDIVTDPAGQTAKLEALLGVQLDSQVLRSAELQRKGHVTAPDVADSIGRWQANLSAEDTAYIQRKLSAAMNRFGYC